MDPKELPVQCGARISVTNAEGISWTTLCTEAAGHPGSHVGYPSQVPVWHSPHDEEPDHEH